MTEPEAPRNGSEASPAISKSPRPKKFLPTDRIGFPKQLEILRAYGVLYDSKHAPVAIVEAGGAAGLKESSAALPNAFFQEAGFLIKGAGGFMPAEEVISYARTHSWDEATAGHKLRPLVEAAWFGQTLLPQLKMGPKDEGQAIAILAEAVAAAPEYKPQLKTLLDYLLVAGSVERDGNLLRVARTGQAPSLEEKPDLLKQETSGSGRMDFTQDAQVMRFNVSFDISMVEISRWPPDRITAFFSGIAQVMAAKGGIEKGGSGG